METIHKLQELLSTTDFDHENFTLADWPERVAIVGLIAHLRQQITVFQRLDRNATKHVDIEVQAAALICPVIALQDRTSGERSTLNCLQFLAELCKQYVQAIPSLTDSS